MISQVKPMVMTMLQANNIVNGILFQGCWLACAIGSARGLTWPALLGFAVLAAWQLQPPRRARSDVKLLGIALVLGLIFDTLWLQLDLLSFTTSTPVAGIAPAWILFLWLAFALTVNHSLVFLKAHPLLPAIMGMIGGPMAYFAGVKFGAISYHGDPLLVSACLALGWALSMIILVRASD